MSIAPASQFNAFVSSQYLEVFLIYSLVFIIYHYLVIGIQYLAHNQVQPRPAGAAQVQFNADPMQCFMFRSPLCFYKEVHSAPHEIIASALRSFFDETLLSGIFFENCYLGDLYSLRTAILENYCQVYSLITAILENYNLENCYLGELYSLRTAILENYIL